MESEKLIYSGRWSRGYQKGNEFIKELVYYEPALADREIRASLAAYAAGLNTPRFLYSNDNGSKVRIHYEWKQVNPIFPDSLFSIFSAVQNIIGLLQTVEWIEDDKYWEEILLKDFADALSYIGREGKSHLKLIKSLKPSVFIHGDFSFKNMGTVGNSVLVYDFQHGCIGPECWDRLHFASTLDPSLCANICQSEYERQIVCAIAAIRLGRALRKNKKDIQIKRLSYLQWKASINII